jgi:hypothetical protein
MAAERKHRQRVRDNAEARGEPVPDYARIRTGLPPNLFAPQTSVTDTGRPSGSSASKIEEGASRAGPALVDRSTLEVDVLVCRPAWLICDFCGGQCGPLVRLDVGPRGRVKRPSIWTGNAFWCGGVLDAAKEAMMELDPSRVRRPNPRFGWGWVDRRIILQADAYLAPMNQVEVVVYLFLCLAADRCGMSWYGPAALSRLLKRSPDEIRKAVADLAARHLIALAGRFAQVIDLDSIEAWQASLAPRPVVVANARSSIPAPAEVSAREELARLPDQQREELRRHAREHLARILGPREPSASALDAVAIGFLRARRT